MANRRIFYATEAFGLAPFATGQNPPVTPSGFTAVRGLQSLGVNTRFNLEQVFEIGQLAIYENIENLPDVEINTEKALDGYCPVYLLATQGAVAATLIGRSNQRANAAMSIYTDTASLASGAPNTQCVMSGVYISQVAYDMDINGNARETCTLIGNNKVWATGSPFTFSGFTPSGGVTSLSPYAPEGVNRRQDMVMASCRWPTEIPGISSSGTNDVDNTNSSGPCFGASIQSVRVSAPLNREDIFELGRRQPYFKYVGFPVEITTAIEINGKAGDLIQGTEDGILGSGNNLSPQAIKVVMQEGLIVDLGSQNKLSGVQHGGGNAGARGGNVTLTYNYVTQNDFTVTHPQDATVALRV